MKRASLFGVSFSSVHQKYGDNLARLDITRSHICTPLFITVPKFNFFSSTAIVLFLLVWFVCKIIQKYIVVNIFICLYNVVWLFNEVVLFACFTINQLISNNATNRPSTNSDTATFDTF